MSQLIFLTFISFLISCTSQISRTLPSRTQVPVLEKVNCPAEGLCQGETVIGYYNRSGRLPLYIGKLMRLKNREYENEDGVNCGGCLVKVPQVYKEINCSLVTADFYLYEIITNSFESFSAVKLDNKFRIFEKLL